MVSTWVVKLQEHAEADVDLVKTFKIVFGENQYALAA